MSEFMRDDFFRLQMGIRRPKTAEEEKQHATLDGMRKAIEMAQRDSPLIRACLDSARYNGMNGEDTYTMLAYHALVALEDHYRRHSELLNLLPVPPIVVPREPL
jgi:hypothetical protein